MQGVGEEGIASASVGTGYEEVQAQDSWGDPNTHYQPEVPAAAYQSFQTYTYPQPASNTFQTTTPTTQTTEQDRYSEFTYEDLAPGAGARQSEQQHPVLQAPRPPPEDPDDESIDPADSRFACTLCNVSYRDPLGLFLHQQTILHQFMLAGEKGDNEIEFEYNGW
ncbi:hypothetical protein BDZ91DRAFT_741188 [Kalaharituber pfeilii]|nr:hypothetical protein BDZ91DRAFT_741188 [Kalaharituber pfeilii]